MIKLYFLVLITKKLLQGIQIPYDEVNHGATSMQNLGNINPLFITILKNG